MHSFALVFANSSPKPENQRNPQHLFDEVAARVARVFEETYWTGPEASLNLIVFNDDQERRVHIRFCSNGSVVARDEFFVTGPNFDAELDGDSRPIFADNVIRALASRLFKSLTGLQIP